MPLFAYRCPLCGESSDELHGRNDNQVIPCEVCKTPMKKLLSSGKFKYRAGSFFEPFITEDITGEPVQVKSKDHLHQLCRKHNLTPKYGPEKLR